MERLNSFLLLFCCLINMSNGIRQLGFARMVSTSDPAFQYVFSSLGLSRTFDSSAECSSWVFQYLNLPVKAQRASGFVYNRTTSICTLGRTPTYNDFFVDNGIVPQEAAEAYVLLGKPLASVVNNDTYFYALLNEEQSEYFSHPNFIMAWPSSLAPTWSGVSYTINSPIASFGGQYAATFQPNTYLRFITPAPNPSGNNITILIWFKPLSGQVSGQLFSMCKVPLPVDSSDFLLEFWLTFSNLQMWIPLQGVNFYSNAGTVSNSQWAYYGFTYTAATKTYGTWMNAVLIGNGSGTAIPNVWSNLAAVIIGGNCLQNIIQGGTFGSVELYSRALTQTEMQQKFVLSTSGRTETGVLPA